MIPTAQHCFFDDPAKPIIYVGREAELETMYDLWESDAIEHSIVKIANIPGIGKTELVHQFFRTYGMAENAVLVYINFKDILNQLLSVQSPANAYIVTNKIIQLLLPQIEWYYQRQKTSIPTNLITHIEELKGYKIDFASFLNMFFDYFHDKRILFFFDEIQSMYGVGIESLLTERKLHQVEKWIEAHQNESVSSKNPLYETIKIYQQGVFRSLSMLMAALIPMQRTKHLIIVSGTQYKIINSLEDLGSPIADRVTDLRLVRLSFKDMNEWLDRAVQVDMQYKKIWESVKILIMQYAGGIPRILTEFISAIPKDTNSFLHAFQTDFQQQKKQYFAIADRKLRLNILRRIHKLQDDFGKQQIQKLISRIARYFLFADYASEKDVSAWINEITTWKNVPSPADIVQAGLLLRVNGYVEEDYIIHHTLVPKDPLALVSNYTHELLKQEFIDNIWFEEMGIILNETLLNTLRTSPSVVGFAFEYYFAVRLLQLSQNNLNLIKDGKSPYFSNTKQVNIPQNLIITPLNNLQSVVNLEEITFQLDTIYLLSRTKAIDGIIITKSVVILYQLKFTKDAPKLKDAFYLNFVEIEQSVKQIIPSDLPIYRMLFSYTEPSALTKLNECNILVCNNLDALLGKSMMVNICKKF